MESLKIASLYLNRDNKTKTIKQHLVHNNSFNPLIVSSTKLQVSHVVIHILLT